MTYYHGGIPGLRIGDEVLPPTRTGMPNSAARIVAEYDLDGPHVRDDVVFLASTEVMAAMFAAMYPAPTGGWIYECEAREPVEDDPDYRGPSGESVQAPSALIVRVVGPLAQSDVNDIRRLLSGGMA